jgi:hypothetical protein
MRSFTALTLLLALISVLQTNAGASRRRNLTDKSPGKSGSKSSKSPGKSGSKCPGKSGRKSKKVFSHGDAGAGKSKDHGLDHLVTSIHNAVNDKQVSKPAATFIAASIIWFVLA